MALIDDWKDAAQRDTAARAISQGASRALGLGFGNRQQPDVPAADAAAYQQRTGLAAAATPKPAAAPMAAKTGPTGLAAAAAPQLGAPTQPAAPVPNAMPTSEPGINKVTGIAAGASPLYTNVGAGQNQASPQPTQQPAAPGGFDPAKAASQPGQPAPNLGFSPNEGIARTAMANATRQSMIDAQPTGGFAVLGGLDSQGRTQQQRENDAKTTKWRQDELMTAMQRGYGGAAGVAAAGQALGSLTGAETQRDVEGMRQQGIAADVLAKRRGQDMSFAAQQQQQGLAARAQEQNAAMGIGKLGIDQERLGLDREIAMRGAGDWGVQVTPATRSADGSTAEGSVIRFNKRTGQVEKIGGGNRASTPIDQNPQALAIKNNPSMTREQKVAALMEMGYS